MKAKLKFAECLKLDNKFHFAHYNLAWIYAKEKNIDKMKIYLDNLVDIDQDDVDYEELVYSEIIFEEFFDKNFFRSIFNR